MPRLIVGDPRTRALERKMSATMSFLSVFAALCSTTSAPPPAARRPSASCSAMTRVPFHMVS